MHLKEAKPQPLASRPENWYKVKEVVGLFGIALDKYGRFITATEPLWTIMPRWAKQLYRELADLGGKEGQLYPSLAYIGFDLMQVTSERARQQMRAMINWGFIERERRPAWHGWFDSNRYALVDPLAPKHLIAIAVRTFDKGHPIKIIHLSQQVPPEAVPEFLPMRKRRQADLKPKPIVAEPPANQPRAIILSERFRSIALGLGLIDPRHQHDAWNRFQARKAELTAKGKRIKSPGAYWTGIVKHVIAELRDAMAEAAAGHQAPADDISQTQADRVVSLVTTEASNRRSWIVVQAYQELMEGHSPDQAAARIFSRPALHRYCRHSPCSIDEVLEHVGRVAAALPTG